MSATTTTKVHIGPSDTKTKQVALPPNAVCPAQCAGPTCKEWPANQILSLATTSPGSLTVTRVDANASATKPGWDDDVVVACTLPPAVAGAPFSVPVGPNRPLDAAGTGNAGPVTLSNLPPGLSCPATYSGGTPETFSVGVAADNNNNTVMTVTRTDQAQKPWGVDLAVPCTTSSQSVRPVTVKDIAGYVGTMRKNNDANKTFAVNLLRDLKTYTAFVKGRYLRIQIVRPFTTDDNYVNLDCMVALRRDAVFMPWTGTMYPNGVFLA